MPIRHGGCGTRLYRIWKAMRRRCRSDKDSAYQYYGGRGIDVCDEWKNDFSSFRLWAEKSGYKDSLTIDRIDTNKNYHPQNCRWISIEEQQRNRRSCIKIDGKCLKQFCRETGRNYHTVYGRIFNYGWSIEDALNKNIKGHINEM